MVWSEMVEKAKKEFWVLVLLFLVSCTPVRVDMMNREGQHVGGLRVWQTHDGVRIVGTLDIQKGVHAFHIHEHGVCELPEFASAGSHFNPFNKEHGLENPKGPHAGDLPNIDVRSPPFRVNVRAPLVTLKESRINSLLKEGGTAIVIHEQPDDHVTDPAGAAGGRIACGVIKQ